MQRLLNTKMHLFSGNMKKMNIGLMLAFVTSLFISTVANAQQDGKSIYEMNCVACHAMEQKLVGPPLKGVHEKYSEEWLIKWIRNSQALVASGDEKAVAIFEEYNKMVMPAYDNLSDEEIKGVIAHIKVLSDEAAKTTVVDTSKTNTEVSVEEYGILARYGVMVWIAFAILVVLLVLYLINRKLQKDLEAKIANGQINPDQYEILLDAKKIKPATFIAVSILGTVVLLGAAGVYGTKTVGIQQGYAPTQPIAFSHELHAGTHNIECSYCHTGVERGKMATIPSANVCMNCHNQIKTESPEIKKIWNAVETGRPIEWIRIHNLPDFAYFNHLQHYKIAGIACQTCHGEIQEMKVVAQHSNLTMGWCINCHRETEVNLENGYYQEVHAEKIKEHKEAKANNPHAGLEGITIANMGGLECSKCHY